jgi:type II secretory pathway pseudopilin PulG
MFLTMIGPRTMLAGGMRTERDGTGTAFTLLEVLVVIVLILVAVAAFLPLMDKSRDGGPGYNSAHCLNNLRQIDLGLRMFGADNGDKFPQLISADNGGVLELGVTNSAAVYFRTLSAYVITPGSFVCPADKSRSVASNIETLNDTNLSYFFGFDATPALPASFVAGDRTLQIAGQASTPGLRFLTSSVSVGWTTETHTKEWRRPSGVLAFADGHGEILGRDVSYAVMRQGLATNRLVFP